MTLKTCLLVTDDPDDHQAFSEAVTKISNQTVVLIVLDSQKAMELLLNKNHPFDFIFLDLSMHGIRINAFIKTLKSDETISSVPTVVYGTVDDYNRIDNPAGLTFFNKEYEFSELTSFLTDFFKEASKL